MAQSNEIKTGGKEYLPGAATLLANAFKTDPTLTYVLSSIPKSKQADYRPKYFHALLKAAVLNGGTIDELHDFQSCGVLLPPGSDIANPHTALQAGFLGMFWNVGIGGYRRMVDEVAELEGACKAKAIAEGERHYYVFFLGTDESARGKGLCSRIVRGYQERAAKEGCPIWMGAGMEYCRELYESLGFEVVEEILVGKGKADRSGNLRDGGEGFFTWGMVWRPEGYVRK